MSKEESNVQKMHFAHSTKPVISVDAPTPTFCCQRVNQKTEYSSNIFASGELQEDSVISKMEITADFDKQVKHLTSEKDKDGPDH